MQFPALEEVRAQLAKIFDEAGPDMDLDKVTCLGKVSNKAKIAEVKRLNDQHDDLKAVEASASNPLMWEPSTGPRDGRPGLSGERGAAQRLVQNSADLPDGAKEKVVRLLEGPEAQALPAALWATATGDGDYASAFRKILQHGPTNAALAMTDRERAAFGRVQRMRNALVIGTDSSGGYMVPLHLDPAILLSSDGSVNPLRQIARVEQITSDVWNGVSSAGVTAEWLAESAEAADATPTLGQPTVPVHKASAWVPFSYEWAQDARRGEEELAILLTDAADQLEAAAYSTGTGTGQPTGLITALDGTASEVAPATAETFDSADVYSTLEAVPARFRARAKWMAALSTINSVDRFETTNGAKLFARVGDVEPVLLQRRLFENSGMRGTADIDPAVTSDNHILVAGDFRNFLIVDRIGSTIDFVQNVFGANNRPTGERGLFMWFRTGSDVLVNEAFRVLNVHTTA